MLIDWFTVVAQIINFLILVGLLKWLLYDRIVRVMDQRERDIAARLDEAQQKRAEADQLVADAAEKTRRIDAEREAMLTDARGEADARRDEWTREARQQADELRHRWEQSVEHQRQHFLSELRERVGLQTVDLARRVLAELADTDLQDRVVTTFLRKLRETTDDERTRLIETIGGVDEPIGIYSSFPLNDEQRGRIADLLHEWLGPDRQLDYREDRDLICGVELRSMGHAVGWNIDGHLGTLVEAIGRSLKGTSAEAAATGGSPS